MATLVRVSPWNETLIPIWYQRASSLPPAARRPPAPLPAGEPPLGRRRGRHGWPAASPLPSPLFLLKLGTHHSHGRSSSSPSSRGRGRGRGHGHGRERSPLRGRGRERGQPSCSRQRGPSTACRRRPSGFSRRCCGLYQHRLRRAPPPEPAASPPWRGRRRPASCAARLSSTRSGLHPRCRPHHRPG